MAIIITLSNKKHRYAECSECGYTQWHLLLSIKDLSVDGYECVECGEIIELESNDQIVFEAE